MKFIASNVTQKTASTGKPMWNATLTGEDGASTTLNFFDEIKEGQEISGELYVNEKGYTNFKSAQKAAGANFATAKKEEVINRAMDKKSDSIAHAGSITNATHLVVAMLNANVYAIKTEESVKNKVREMITWYRTMYENPDSVAPF
jgi:hypothetical protein